MNSTMGDHGQPVFMADGDVEEGCKGISWGEGGLRLGEVEQRGDYTWLLSDGGSVRLSDHEAEEEGSSVMPSFHGEAFGEAVEDGVEGGGGVHDEVFVGVGDGEVEEGGGGIFLDVGVGGGREEVEKQREGAGPCDGEPVVDVPFGQQSELTDALPLLLH